MIKLKFDTLVNHKGNQSNEIILYYKFENAFSYFCQLTMPMRKHEGENVLWLNKYVICDHHGFNLVIPNNHKKIIQEFF